jgi:hypothetical protein
MFMLQTWAALAWLMPALMLQAPPSAPAPDPFAPIRGLVGTWQTTGEEPEG